MATIFGILSWLAGVGAPVLFIFFVYKFFRGFVKLKEGVTVPKMLEFFKFVAPSLLLLVFVPILSDAGMLTLLKKANSEHSLVIIKDIGVGLSSEKISVALSDSYQFKLESGHHPLPDKYLDFLLEGYADFDFRINPDNRDENMYWVSVDNILGHRSIGFMRL